MAACAGAAGSVVASRIAFTSCMIILPIVVLYFVVRLPRDAWGNGNMHP